MNGRGDCQIARRVNHTIMRRGPQHVDPSLPLVVTLFGRAIAVLVLRVGLDAPFRSAPPVIVGRPTSRVERSALQAAHDQPRRNEMIPMHQQERATDTNSFCIEQQWWPTEVPEESDG